MKIAIACDHAAVELKKILIEHLTLKGNEIKDYGEPNDYPAAGYAVGTAVANGECKYGVLICGTGVGISLAANKVKGVRAAVCSDPYTARMTKTHNDANIIAMGARVVGSELAKMIVDEFFAAEFEGGRHSRRVDMITAIENGNFFEG